MRFWKPGFCPICPSVSQSVHFCAGWCASWDFSGRFRSISGTSGTKAGTLLHFQSLNPLTLGGVSCIVIGVREGKENIPQT